MNNKEISLQKLVGLFDNEFKVVETEKDPAMSRFVPMVYDLIDFNWEGFFEDDFTDRFNGLMINGEKPIKKIVCCVFFNNEIARKVLEMEEDGIMIFAHHPVQMECGDPEGEKGRGFLPIDPGLLNRLKERGVSVYTCHAPLDAGSKSGLGTAEAYVKRLGLTLIEQYYPYAHGYAGRLCQLPHTIMTSALISRLQEMINLPYVDLQGVEEREISKVVILPGGGGSYDDIKGAEDKGADCIITGEVTAKIDGERGDKESALLDDYYPNATISAIGLSHAGSEFLVMYDIVKWMKENIGIEAEVLPEENWWR
jgi:putative NIF3 family GTP cyclohydrolase 1 type 2